MSQEQQTGRRPHLGIMFKCCHQYGYIYKNKAGTEYTGHCPKCMRAVKVRIATDGTGSSQRIFEAF